MPIDHVRTHVAELRPANRTILGRVLSGSSGQGDSLVELLRNHGSFRYQLTLKTNRSQSVAVAITKATFRDCIFRWHVRTVSGKISEAELTADVRELDIRDIQTSELQIIDNPVVIQYSPPIWQFSVPVLPTARGDAVTSKNIATGTVSLIKLVYLQLDTQLSADQTVIFFRQLISDCHKS